MAITRGPGQPNADPWLILADGEIGAINTQTSRSELVARYGANNIVDQDVDIGEGETQPGTVLFPKDPQRHIEILWRDTDKKTQPASAQIDGGSSRWHAVHGISLGISLQQLEQLNGRPFKLTGFDWDYAGTITSWEGGTLTAELDSDHGKIFLRLAPRPRPDVSEKELSEVAGDRDFSSQHPVMQKLNPQAYQIIWVFPAQSEK